MPLETGFLLQDRYRIERVLGHGGMGAVYLATDESLGIQCAVKENLNLSPDSERQFRREATLLASLRHPNLPRTTNHFILGGQQYLVMDFVEGEDLKERQAREHPLPVATVLTWVYQICDALTYLHGHQPVIIHRDIKPANIKLTAAGDAMLVDFGIAKATGTGQKTTTGAVALTPGFAPPEQYGMGRADGRTDEYALAATVYTLLTGHTPPDSMERLLGNAEMLPPDQLRPDIPPTVSEAIMRALSVRPDARFATVAEFKAALRGELPSMATVSPSSRSTVMTSAQETVLHTAAETRDVASSAETRLAERPPSAEAVPTETAKPKGRSAWLIVVGVVVVLGVLVVGGGALAAALAPSLFRGGGLFPAPTATQAPTPTLVLPTPVIIIQTATFPPATATATPLPPTATVPPVSPTATTVPLTATPTTAPSLTPSAAPLVGGGGRIAFISNRDGQHYQIYTMKSDGSDVKQLTTDDSDKWSPTWQFHGTQLAWSPDGTRLLYVASVKAGGTLNVWMINVDGSSPAQNITAAEPGRPSGDDYDPAWCKDGTIAFTTKRYNGVPQIATMTLDDPRPRNTSLLDRFGPNPNEWNEVFFPQNCKRMVNVTVQNGMAEIWRVFPDLKSWRVFMSDIKSYNASAEEPAISLDEKTLVYTRFSDKAKDIIRTTIDDSPAVMQLHAKVLDPTGNNFQPQWSPDGKWITFVSQRDGNREIYMITSAGTDSHAISKNPADDVCPAWQPVAVP